MHYNYRVRVRAIQCRCTERVNSRVMRLKGELRDGLSPSLSSGDSKELQILGTAPEASSSS